MKEFTVIVNCDAQDLSEALLEAAAYVQAFQPMFTHMNVDDQVPVNDYIRITRPE